MMRKEMRRGLALAVALVLLLSIVLAGCGKSDGGSQEPNGEKKDAGAEKKEEITVSIYDRGNIPAEEGTPVKNRWTDWINENAPVKVNFVAIPRWEEDQKYNTLLASGNVPDLIMNWSPKLRSRLYGQNMLLPLDEWIEKHSPAYKKVLEQYPAMKTLGTRDDGKLYQLGGVAKMEPSLAMWIRADWLKKLNLEVPATTEELFAVMKAFAEQDPDGNNKKDTYGAHLSFVGGKIIENMFGADNAVGWYLNNGAYIHDWDRTAAAAAYKKRMYDAGLVDKDFLTDQNGEKAQQDFVNGRLGVYGVLGVAQPRGFQIFETLKNNNPNAEIIAIPLPKSEFGQFSPEVSPPYSISAVVNKQAKNPEAVMKYIDFLLQDSTQRTLKYGLEDVHWKADANGCPAPIDVEKNSKELSWNFDLSMLAQPISEGDCLDYAATQLNPEKPLEKAYIEIVKQAREVYLSPERPIQQDIDLSTSPELPQDLTLNKETALKAAQDIFAKSIVGGAAYPIDKALTDAKAVWEKGGGIQVDEATAEWYAKNKENILLTKDYYDKK
ncbi:extracellular solute-binding protein [Paenibacillus eucommiae]|uniref:Aldouronate transport system substrate-binding protein n=1 Tax=Paenibacillus eucommiae TaxID=1355755 RepID=A0ABS4IUG8_9BACL|nr:extracellular solute-binding protein [Paenibacillus eucommiae]MBP1990730.1 putative aldouronate transport system substrate-binding protein [Paenibacillus eucommiae]